MAEHPVVYALDIGVYNLGAASQLLASTTAAWCRCATPPGTLAGVTYTYSGTPMLGRFDFADGSSAECGRSIERLAHRIQSDLEQGRAVALGFEAPMWFPVYREHAPSLKLFAPRFDAESGHAWYLQAGAAATLKAIGLGRLLASQLSSSKVRLMLSTNPDAWRSGSLTLFEAFVAGDYKFSAPEGAAGSAENEWDAAIAAVAWYTAHGPTPIDVCPEDAACHVAGSCEDDVVSVWDVVFGGCVPPVRVRGPLDCEVVGIRPLSSSGQSSGSSSR
jgi:hypothetical protein